MTPNAVKPSDTSARALQAMLCPHTTRLLAYLRRHIPPGLQSVIDEHDVVQDALLDATLAVDDATFDGPESVWRWLATIARHRLIRHITAQSAMKRGGQMRRLGAPEAKHSSVVEMLQDLAVHHRTPSKSVARREFLVVLGQSLDRLPPDHRDAVRLRYVEGLSLKDTAARLSRTEDSTQKLCVRGLEALRVELRTVSLYL
jgi:RNA polymerase sigma-70 factor (ECF subfamily)